MGRTTTLTLAALTAFFVLMPLATAKPGMPPTLKSDEPAYYLMALSLARDGDLRCEAKDLERLFQEFPFLPADNLIVMSDDGWHTAYFGKPYLYSLFAAPATALFGANGMVAFNMALLLTMVWLGTLWARRFNPEPVAALFAAGFFLLSTGFVYAFWLHPEVFMMACGMVALYFGLADAPEEGSGEAGAGRWGRLRRRLFGRYGRLAWSGAALLLGAYHKPVLVLLGLPVLVRLARFRRWRELGVWLAAGTVTLGVICGLAVAWTGHPSAYLGVSRTGVRVENPEGLPIPPLALGEQEEARTRNSWFWIFRVPRFEPGEVMENLGYFFYGRHTGLIPYMPLALLALGWFLVSNRSPESWTLLAALAGIGLFFLLWIPFNWHGGGGFVGNRYFVIAYPGFFFLVRRLRPPWLLVPAYGAAALLLGPLLFTPWGAPVPYPTLQAHVRGSAFAAFPREQSLQLIPGYQGVYHAPVWFEGRRDVFQPRGDEMWLRGGAPVEVWMVSLEPLEEVIFRVRDLASGNRVRFELPGDRETLTFGPVADVSGAVQDVVLRPSRPSRTRRERGDTQYIYRLEVHAEKGAKPDWLRAPGADPVPQGDFYLGTALMYLGDRAELERDLFALEWSRCRVPRRVRAGGGFEVGVELINRSAETWPASGPTRVQLSYHWYELGEDGPLPRVWGGGRTALERDVPAGGRARARLEVAAPAEPGVYLFAADAVREQVDWFSARGGIAGECGGRVRVLPAGEGEDPETSEQEEP